MILFFKKKKIFVTLNSFRVSAVCEVFIFSSLLSTSRDQNSGSLKFLLLIIWV